MVEVTLNTPLAEALNSAIQPKLVEVGWSTGGVDDSALSEYIILMLVNGKTQDQIAAELSGDLLQLGPDDPGAIEFSRWLFDQVEVLNGNLNGTQTSSSAPTSPPAAAPGADASSHTLTEQQRPDGAENAMGQGGQDTEMGDGGNGFAEGNIPSGPRSMRGNRNKRLFGQLSKAMDRNNESVLHRVRPQQGTERISSHSREAPKGPRNGPSRNQRMPSGRGGGMMQGGGMPHMGPGAALGQMTAQQQMQLFAMYEEQARMMSQILSPQQQQHMFMGQAPAGPMSGSFGGNLSQPQQQGRSLFDRVENKPNKQGGGTGNRLNPNASSFQKRDRPGDGAGSANKEPSSAMEVEASQPASDTPAADTVCKFNLTCTKPDCPFAHQSPAAPPGMTIDVNDHCSFGAACKNRKCVARHPSPANKASHQAEQDCKFFPNCTNPACPFRHPTSPLCRNGADCTRPGCTFTHVKTTCKYNPCLNSACPFKHVDGQKRGKFDDKVWSANDAKGGEHVSERKFVDENATEELIIPSGSAGLGDALVT